MSFFGPDAVWDLSLVGLGTYEGIAAIRGFFEDWIGTYEEYEVSEEEMVELGGGVTFVVQRQSSSSEGKQRRGHAPLRPGQCVG